MVDRIEQGLSSYKLEKAVGAVVEDDGDSVREGGADEVVGASDMLRATMSMDRKASKRCVNVSTLVSPLTATAYCCLLLPSTMSQTYEARPKSK